MPAACRDRIARRTPAIATASIGGSVPPSVQERNQIGDIVIGTRRLEPWRDSVDRYVALPKLLCEHGRDRFSGRDAEDGRATTEVARRVPIEDRGAANRGVDDDVDAGERRDRLSEHSLDVEVVREVGAYGDRCAGGGEDLFDRRFGCALIVKVARRSRSPGLRACVRPRGRSRESRR